MSTTQVFEKAVLLKLFHNESLQRQYLPELLPGLWSDKKDVLLVFIMKYIHNKGWKMSVDNIILAQRTPEVIRFARAQKTFPNLQSEELSNLLYDINIDTTDNLFRETYEELHNLAFARDSLAIWGEAIYETAYHNPYIVLAKANAIRKLFNIIYTHKFGSPVDYIDKTADSINNKTGFIRLSFSPKLNGLIGGLTRGWGATLLGRPQHTKSTIMTLDCVLKALHNSVGDIDVILTEESEEIFYQRVFAILLKIPISHMRNRLVKITNFQKDKVRSLLGNRLHIHRYSTFKDVIDILFTLKNHYVWIDHINAIQYQPRTMVEGISYLISKEVEFLKTNPEAVIVNLSQVNEQNLLTRTGRAIWKHPSYTDAYGSQILHHHSREYLTVYYPYKDTINNPQAWAGKRELREATQNDVYIKVEKSSFGDLAGLKFKYQFDFGILEDTEDKVSNVELPDLSLLESLK